ncbi:MAG: hypothetical protein JW776_10400 [Candidatus Lokiarchaeota archaeon]|nr:hypothetical protein [Candidatus Lokiarchaeota archaeon]
MNVYGSDTFTLWLVDSGGLTDSVTITITINPVNDNPTILNPTIIQGNSSWTQDEDFGTFSFHLSGFESDVEDWGTDLDWYITGLDTSLVTVMGQYSDSDILVFSSVANASGIDTFTLWLIDSGGLTDSISITIQVIEVNDAPWITDKTIIINNETWNQWENFADFEFYLKLFENDVDHDDHELTWSIDPGYSLFKVVNIDGAADVITFGSLSAIVGYESFILRLTDDGGLFDTVEVYINVTGILDISVVSANNGSNYFNDDEFDIQVYVDGITRGTPITDATISYSIMGAEFTSDNVQSLGGGYYNITIYGWEATSLGQIDIQIRAEKNYFITEFTSFTYYRYIRTTQSLSPTTYYIIRGNNVTLSPYFLNNASIGISSGTLIWNPINAAFLNSWQYSGGGLYELELDSTPVLGSSSYYTINFTITRQWYLTQQYSVNIYVINRTSLEVLSLEQVEYGITDSNTPYDLYYGTDISITIRYLDIDNDNTPIIGAFANLTYNGITYYDTTDSNGEVTFIIPTGIQVVGNDYSIPMIGVNKSYYQTQTTSTTFDINNCPTYYDDLIITQYGELLDNSSGDFIAWYGDDLHITVEFRNSFTNALIAQATGTLTFSVTYQDTDLDANGIYEWNIDFDTIAVGNDYLFSVDLIKANYETESFNIRVDLIAVPTTITITSVKIDTTTLTYNGGTDTYSGEYYGSDIFVEIQWRNAKDNSLISTATTGQIDFNGVNYNYDSEIGGIYSWQLDYLDSIAGNNSAEVTFTKANYATATDSFGIYIATGLTDLTVWAVYNGNWNSSATGGVYPTYQVYDTYVFVRFFDTNNGYWIDGTKGNASLVINGITYYNTSGTVDGFFMFTLPAGTYSGIISVSVNSNHSNYADGNDSFQLNYLLIPTQISNVSYTNANGPLGYTAVTNTYTAKGGSDITIVVRFDDIIHGLSVSSATSTLLSTTEGNLIDITDGLGEATFILDNSFYYSGSVYYFTITITLTNYQTSNIEFYISFITWQTDSLITQVNQTSSSQNITATGATYDLLRNFNTTITAQYWNIDNGSLISGATALLFFGGTIYETTTNSTGYAVWTLETEFATVGVYTCYIEFSKEDHQSQNINFNLNLTLITTNGVLQDVIQPDHTSNTLPYFEYSYQAYMSYNLSVEASYMDTFFGGGINDATATLTFDGTPYVETIGVGGVYTWTNIPIFDKTGQYTITIIISKINWESVNFMFNITIQPLPTEVLDFDITQSEDNANTLSFSGPPGYYYIAYTKYGVQVYLTYRDINNSVSINSTTATLSFNGFSYYDYTGDDGQYTWLIPADDLTLGIFLVVIIMESQFYETQNYAFNLSLNNLPTETQNFDITQPDHGLYGTDSLIFQGLPEGYFAYVAYGFSVNLSYWDLNHLISIPGATTSSLEFRNVNYSSAYYGDGIYGWQIDQSLVALGTYTVRITFDLDDYEQATYSFVITFYNLPTDMILNSIVQPDHGDFDNLTQNGEPSFDFVAYNAYDTEVSIYFYDLNNTAYISGANPTLSFNSGTIFIDSEFEGNYTWTIPTLNLEEGMYLISVTFTLSTYQTASLQFNLTLQVLPTTLSFTTITQTDHTPNPLPLQGSHYVVYTRYGIQIFYEYYDTENGVGIENADVHRLALNSKNYNSVSDINGLYLWIIPESDLNTEGVYTITITIQKLHYENHTDEFTINTTFIPTDYTFDDIIQPDHLGHETDTLVYTIADNSFNGFKVYDVQVFASYFDTNNSIGIVGATCNLIYNGIPVLGSDLSNGNYSFLFPSDDLILNTKILVTINFQRLDYDSVSFNFFLIVRVLPTNYTEVGIYHQIPGYDGNLTQNGDFLTAYKLFNNITFEFGYWDINNSIFLSNAATASLYINGTYNSEATVDTFNNIFRWILNLDSISFGYFYARFEFTLLGYQSQVFTYNILLQKLNGSAEFELIQQFGQNSEQLDDNHYRLYSGSSSLIQYTFQETTYDIPASYTTVNLSIMGTQYWFLAETNENGTAIWNIPINLLEGDYVFKVELNPDEFDPLIDEFTVTITYRDTRYENLEVQDYGHSMEEENLAFEFAYFGNDLIILVHLIDNYTNSELIDGIAELILGGTSFYGTYIENSYQIIVPETYIATPILNFNLNLNRTYFHNTSVAFTVNVLNKNEIRISPMATLPTKITPGTETSFRFIIEYRPDGSTEWTSLGGATVELQIGSLNISQVSNTEGVLTFTFTVPSSDSILLFSVIFSETFDSETSIYNGSINISSQLSKWFPYGAIGFGLIVVTGSITLIATRKRRKSKRMIKDIERKVEQEEITEEEETFEDLLEKEKEEVETTETEATDTTEKSKEENIDEEGEEQSGKHKETSREETESQEDPTQKEETRDTLEEKIQDEQEKFIIDEKDSIELNIEKTTIHQIREQTIRSKNDLWKAIDQALKDHGIEAEMEQIKEVFEKLRKENKIGFETKTKPIGWKLKDK